MSFIHKKILILAVVTGLLSGCVGGIHLSVERGEDGEAAAANEATMTVEGKIVLPSAEEVSASRSVP